MPQIALDQEMNAVIDVFDRGLQDPERLEVRALWSLPRQLTAPIRRVAGPAVCSARGDQLPQRG